MPRLLIWWELQPCAHSRQVQQVVVLPAHDHPRPTRGEQIGMRSRKVCCLGKCSLSRSLFCSIDIYHDPMLALPVPYPTWRGGEHRSCHQVFLKERAERFNGPLIKGCQKAGKRCRMRQVRSPKKRHERFGKREESLIKGREGLFPTHGVAKEHHDKINHLVVSHTSACKPYPLLDGFLETQLAEHMS